MHGLLTIGTSAGAAELPVAAAICAAAREAGREPAAWVAAAAGAPAARALDLLAEASGTPREQLAARAFDASAPPLVAARHEGAQLTPAELLEGARAAAAGGTELLEGARDASGGADLLVAASSGGLLAPLAARYSNRDLARELALPVVLAVPASAGMLNDALLAIEAATGAGLAVAAVVVAGWPETPPRVLLDVRGLLEQQAGVAVLALPEDAERGAEALAEAARGWPVGEWAQAQPPARAGAAAGAPGAEPAPPPRRVTLEPYIAWEPRPVGDPRSTPRAQIMATMLEIVGSEGPMTASRAYALYNRASGGRKLTSVARAPLSSAIYWLAQERRVVLVRRDEIPWQDDDVVRMPDSPAVRVRELGSRSLEEVPLDEIAELVQRLRAARGLDDATGLKRAVLGVYGLVRLTTRADEYLGLALDLADGG
jgi:dethiobiotin synthetase